MMMKKMIGRLNRRLRRLLTKRNPRVASISIWYRTQVFDPKGVLVSDSGLKPSHSFVIQFLQILNAITRGTDVSGGKDTGGVARTIDGDEMDKDFTMKVDFGVGVDTAGMVVGTGGAAEDNLDYALTTQVAHGTGAGQLEYQVHTYSDTAEVGVNVDYIINRTFTNTSGGTIAVTEIGIYVESRYVTNTAAKFMILRDVVTQEDVPDGYTLKVTYTMRTTA